ncbi:MAG: ribosomal L7Ae/L30e/S12e/Gadd45 family protein [Firmicutes bacterium]|nr:ribosomal L7Ae/L30e/S12e/Gadd45 family protein [Bacillota bacterium]MCL5038570.1 ribosomal L7Ae/L30e/S12e/Gadd45 family protein [Bacillota bacterium]
MSCDQLKMAKKRSVGTKQTLKAILKGEAKLVFVAKDAEAHVVKDLLRACQERGVELVYADSMQALGAACGIQVGAASAAIIGD